MFNLAKAALLGTAAVTASTQDFNANEAFLRGFNLAVNPTTAMPQELVNMYKGKAIHSDGAKASCEEAPPQDSGFINPRPFYEWLEPKLN